MSSKSSLNEQEFKKLVELLSRRKDELEGRITIDSVRISLAELGLSELLVDSDIEEVRKQVSKEFKRRQFRNYATFGLILTLLIFPLGAYGGFKLKELMPSPVPVEPSEIARLERKIEELEDKNTKLEEELEASEAERDELTQQIEEIANKSENSRNPDTTDSPDAPNLSSETALSSPQSVERQEIIFELQECQKSNTSTTSQTIECSFLITSTRENAIVYLYANQNSNRRSRVVEGGQEYIARRSELGSDRGNYRVQNTLIKDTAMGAKLFFDEVPLTVNKLEVIEVSSYLESSYYDNDLKLEFRNISLSE